ncbi:hypothetical protein [Cyclobacterium qasimii]|uniref:Heparinase II/III-like protein n=2 Tax=Cyclobacterium qasimii TaxID=1350429 RepID=S7VI98_9BACT|nr:hypothetical protein [Cyclobacterium qasimii]EPR69227.1 hypothetical protein ADICYQ_1727 [Cyclobacterium qasimii M12-11B]GEO20981.1 hypothetical protein CQA01_15150 [Cyclobacterium qasimii]
MFKIKSTSIRNGWYIVGMLFLLAVETVSVSAQVASHPFLIVTEDQFEQHREKAYYEPWKSMASDAFKITEEGFNLEERGAYELQDYIGAVALAYILNPEDKSRYSQKVKDLILNQYSKLKPTEKRNWGGVVPPMSSFFVAILALDIVYNDLTQEEILACEKVIESQIFKINRKGSWTEVRLGTHGVWDIYKGLRTGPDEAYFKGTMAQITPDGVSPITIHYAWERVGGGDSRISKAGYMDVLEFTGIDKRYFSNEQLQKFHRWLFSASVNNSKEMAIIGDMLPTQFLSNDLLHARVGNFDAEAAAYAAWFHEEDKKRGHIISYLLPQKELPYPKLPKSSVYEDGGAFLRENAMNPEGIHAVLYNIKGQDEWHTHQEVNGLALSGLGNRLLVNGGRLGAPTRSATLNNTLTINRNDHASRTGNGIIESISRSSFDYAMGDAGTALATSQHNRSMLLLHGTESSKAYVLLLDEVKVGEGEKIYSYLHPSNESKVDTVLLNSSYLAAIDHYPTVEGTALEILYLTTPDSVNQHLVASAVPSSYPGYPDHNRLEAVYSPDELGGKQVLTLLNPIKQTEVKMNLERSIEKGYEINLIQHANGAKDLILNSTQTGHSIEYKGLKFEGDFLVHREIKGTTSFLFAKNARFFTSQELEFKAEKTVTLWMDHQFVSVIVPEATDLYLINKPSKSLYLDDELVESTSSADGFIKIHLLKGSHRLFYK